MIAMEEFFQFETPTKPTEEASVEAPVEAPVESPDDVELDVQKAVVESLAADKAAQGEEISKLRKENYQLKLKINSLEEKIATQRQALEKVGDVLAANTESRQSSQVALLDRNEEIDDNFEGETSDHLLEVITAARDQAETEGRLRRAQLLEAVLVANQPTGGLKAKRNELNKLFNDNINILSGPVIDKLNEMGIAYKNGEDYLLPAEIVKRLY